MTLNFQIDRSRLGWVSKGREPGDGDKPEECLSRHATVVGAGSWKNEVSILLTGLFKNFRGNGADGNCHQLYAIRVR